MRLLIALAVMAFPSYGSYGAERSGTSLSLSMDDGRLTLEADQVPLSRVLHAIADQAGFALDISGALDVKVTESFTDLALSEAIRRLVGRYSFVAEFAPAGARNRSRRLASLLVVGRKASSKRVAAAARGRQSKAGAGRAKSRRTSKIDRERLGELRRLARLRSPEAARKLADFLLKDENQLVRARAATALGGFGDASVSGPLVAALEDTEITVRRRVIVALGNVDGKDVVQRLISILRRDGDRDSRVLAARALGRQGGPRAFEALTEAAGDSNLRVRNAADSGLSLIKKRR